MFYEARDLGAKLLWCKMKGPKRQHWEKSGVEVPGGEIEGQEQLYWFINSNSLIFSSSTRLLSELELVASVEGQPGYRDTSKFSRTLASRPIPSVTASRFWLNAKKGTQKKKFQSVGCISAHLARSGCRGFAPAALAREASPRRDANTERIPRNFEGKKKNLWH